jgi:hypothetical protein
MSKTWDVQIEAIVTKKIRVTAVDEDEAHNLAHDIFDVTNDDHERYIEENTLSIREVSDE